MRVLQLIDSLEPGGAERVAVEYANVLSHHIEGSYLCATRSEGELLTTINPNVNYIYLKRKQTLDYKAIKYLQKYVLEEGIDCIHAHSSSYFFGTLLKIKLPSIILIWHNHLGASASLSGIKIKVLRFCSGYFDTIISVNKELVDWANLKLRCDKVIYLPNFVNFNKESTHELQTIKGEKGKRIVCLANLKNPKGHLFLLESFIIIQKEIPQVTLHLIGRDFNDTYSDAIKYFIKQHNLENNIFIHGLISAPEYILEQCDIGVLSSSSEGLPMALLEYGRSGLAVVTTRVGYCPEVIQDYGTFVSYGDKNAMSVAIISYLNDKEKIKQDRMLYKEHIREHYSELKVIQKIINLYKEIIE